MLRACYKFFPLFFSFLSCLQCFHLSSTSALQPFVPLYRFVFSIFLWPAPGLPLVQPPLALVCFGLASKRVSSSYQIQQRLWGLRFLCRLYGKHASFPCSWRRIGGLWIIPGVQHTVVVVWLVCVLPWLYRFDMTREVDLAVITSFFTCLMFECIC